MIPTIEEIVEQLANGEITQAQGLWYIQQHIELFHRTFSEAKEECEEWFAMEQPTLSPSEEWWATKAYMAAHGFRWPENEEWEAKP